MPQWWSPHFDLGAPADRQTTRRHGDADGGIAEGHGSSSRTQFSHGLSLSYHVVSKSWSTCWCWCRCVFVACGHAVDDKMLNVGCCALYRITSNSKMCFCADHSKPVYGATHCGIGLGRWWLQTTWGLRWDGGCESLGVNGSVPTLTGDWLGANTHWWLARCQHSLVIGSVVALIGDWRRQQLTLCWD